MLLYFRYWMNYIASGFVFFGVIFDAGVWYCVKDLKIFDEEINMKEIELAERQDENEAEKAMT